MANTVCVGSLPKCAWCAEKAHYDFKTWEGPWAYGCKTHYEFYRLYETLGPGKGQKLIMVQPDKPWTVRLCDNDNQTLIIVQIPKAENYDDAVGQAQFLILNPYIYTVESAKQE